MCHLPNTPADAQAARAPESDQLSREKLVDISKANKRLVELSRELGVITADLKAARAELETSDKSLSERTDELTKARADLATSDKSLLEVNEQLIRTLAELAQTNVRLLRANGLIIDMKKANELQREFINIAAHELRTPVQPILGVLSMYEIEPLTVRAEAEAVEEEVRVKKAHLRMVARNAARLARLSSDILDATKIESKTLKMKISSKVDLIMLATEAIEDSRRQIADGEITFVTDFAKECIQVDVDSYRIMQVLANLLNNAIKFTGKGVISVTIKKSNSSTSNDDQVQVIISDNGKGIDSEILPRLFQKFTTKTDNGSGTGLGLYISKAIVEAHRGKIWAGNNNARGATFSFTLPLARS